MEKDRGFCVFIPHSFPPVEGGAQQYMFDICSTMSPERLVILAPLSADEEECRRFDESQPMEIVRYGSIRSRWAMLAAIRRARRAFESRHTLRISGNLPRLARFILLCLAHRSYAASVASVLGAVTDRLENETIDIVHSGYMLPSGLACCALNCLFGIPYVVYTYAKELYMWEEDLVSRLLMKDMLGHASAVVTISGFTRRKLKALGVDDERIFMLPPVVNIPRLLSSASGDPASLRKRYGVEGRRVLLTISHLVERKGQDKVISAMPRVLEDHPDAVYLIGGRGEREEHLKDAVSELGLKDNVVFIGLVREEEISLHYQMCDLFIMTSRHIGYDMEGFGIVYLEAGFWEKPVIAGRTGGVEDAVVDGITGFLVDPESEEDIAAAIGRILEDQQLAGSLGRAARKRVIGDFSFEPGKRIDELNERILAKR